MGAGRTSKIANPEFARSVAEAYATGMSRDEMADLFGCHVDTITNWVNNPIVQAHVSKFITERTQRISRKLDSEIDRRLIDLDDENKYPMELVLKMRRELLERVSKFDHGNSKNEAQNLSDAITSLEENPELAKALQDWAGNGSED